MNKNDNKLFGESYNPETIEDKKLNASIIIGEDYKKYFIQLEDGCSITIDLIAGTIFSHFELFSDNQHENYLLVERDNENAKKFKIKVEDSELNYIDFEIKEVHAGNRLEDRKNFLNKFKI